MVIIPLKNIFTDVKKVCPAPSEAKHQANSIIKSSLVQVSYHINKTDDAVFLYDHV